MKKLLSPAFIFVVCQAGVGFLHYLYQVLADRFLVLEDFGLWSVWFAQLALTLLVAAWFQSLATLDGPRQPLFRILFRRDVSWGIFIASVAAAAFAWSQQNWVVLTAMGWFWQCLQGVFFGRSLARGRLILISFALVVAALLKLMIPAVAVYTRGEVAVNPQWVIDAFYAGVLWGPLAAVFIGLLFDSEIPRTEKAATTTEPLRYRVFFTSLLLAAVTAAAPQFDILVAGHILKEDDLGRFGRVALVYKGFFFLILIFAQLLLSRQIQAGAAQIRRIRFLPLLALGMALSLILALTFPAVWAPTEWVALGVLHISTLTFLYLVVQTEVSAGRWQVALAVLALWCFEFSLAWGLRPSLLQYYGLVLCFEILAILTLLTMELRKPGALSAQKTH